MKKIEKVLLYFRVSKEDQGTIENQIELLKPWVKEQGWIPIGEYRDESSATSIDGRPNFRALLGRVRQGDIDAVVVRHSDRITRTEDLEEWGRIMGVFQKTETLIASPYEGITDVTNMAGQIVEFTKGRMSSEENKKRVERTAVTKQRALDDGLYRQSGSVCYGYVVIPGNRAQKVPPRVEQINREVTVLKEIYRMLVDEGMSVSGICVNFNKRGIKTRRDKDWRPSTMTSILGNTALYGEIISNRWSQRGTKMVQKPQSEWKVAYISKPIFTNRQWQKMNNLLKANSPPGRPKQLEGVYLCRGLLKCELCGSGYTTFDGGRSKSTHKTYYVCPNRRIPEKKLINGATPCTSSPLIRQQLLDNHIWAEIVNFLTNPGRMLDRWIDRREQKRNLEAHKKELAKLRGQDEAYGKQIRKWMDLADVGEELDYCMGKIRHLKGLRNLGREKAAQIKEEMVAIQAAEEYEDRLKAVAEMMKKVSTEKLLPKSSKRRREIVQAFSKRRLLAEILHSLPWDKKRRLLEAVTGGKKIEIKPAEIEQKVKPHWAPRPISVKFEYWFSGRLDVDAIVGTLGSLDVEETLKSLTVSRYRQCCPSRCLGRGRQDPGGLGDRT